MKKVLPEPGKNNIAFSNHIYNLVKHDHSIDHVQPDFNPGNDVSSILNFQTISFTPFFSQPLETAINRAIKRSVDIFLSTIFIAAILTWLTPALAILIKSDSKGPVFFLQKRNKKNGRIFTCIKFRSMIMNEEADLVQAKENDIRITPIGKFLRKYHLDELPQFINVLFGDMSVVGPRPHMISDNLKYEKLISHYSFRSNAKPGITGLAQVSGYTGPVTDIEKMRMRVQMDNFYIRHWSLKLDTMILYYSCIKSNSLNVFL